MIWVPPKYQTGQFNKRLAAHLKQGQRKVTAHKHTCTKTQIRPLTHRHHHTQAITNASFSSETCIYNCDFSSSPIQKVNGSFSRQPVNLTQGWRNMLGPLYSDLKSIDRFWHLRTSLRTLYHLYSYSEIHTPIYKNFHIYPSATI